MTRPTHRPHPIGGCRWSLPAVRRKPMSNDDNEFESYWLCELTGVAVPVAPAACESCPHWSRDRVGSGIAKRARR